MRYLYLLFLGLVPFLSLSQVDYNSESFETAGDLGIWNSGSGSSSVIQTTSTAYDGSRSIYLGGSYSYIITDVLDLSGVTQVDLSFYYKTNASNKFKNGDRLVVESNTGSGWTGEATYNSARTSFTSSGTISITPSAGSTFSSTTQFSIDLITGNPAPDYVYIDLIDIKVYATPTDAPNEIIAYNINPTSFNISWDAVSNATSYKVYQGGTLVNTTSSNTTSFSSLTPNTSYNIEVESLNSYNIPSASKKSKSVTTSKASIGGARFEGGTLTVGAGTAFTTTNMSVDGGNILVNSNSTNSGSFIATGTVTSSVSNAFTYNRYIPDSGGRIFSIPVSDQNVASFVNNSANSLNTFGSFAALGQHKYMRGFGQRWEYYNPNAPGNFDTDFNVAKGYAIMRTAAGNITFTGNFPAISSNQISFNVESFTGSSLQKWRSVGNPFMSYFPGTNTSTSVNSFLKLNGSKLDDNYQALYLWDGSQWIVINNLSNYNLAPGQGFLIKLKDFQSTTLDFPQSYQTHQTSEVFYGRETERSKISLYIEKNKRVAKTEIYYISSGTQGLDPGYDAAAYSTNKLDIQTRLIEESEDLNYTIQAISNLSYEEQEIPISITSEVDQKLQFSADYESIPSALEVYLEDRQNNRFYNLKESSAVLKVSQGTNNHGRFYLHTKPLEFWIEDNTEDDAQDDSVFDLADGIATKAFDFFNLKDNILYFEGVNRKEQVKVNLFNINGYKVFASTADLDSSNNTIQLPYNLSEGVYIVELYRGSGKKTSKKIIIR